MEDNEDTAELIAYLLEDLGTVTLAANAEEALQQVSAASYDLVLLDVNLRGPYSGLHVLHQLRAQSAYQDVPIVAVTAYALPGDRECFLKESFDAYLGKPFTPEELLALVGRLLLPQEKKV